MLLTACFSKGQQQVDPYYQTKKIASDIGRLLITGPGDVTAVSIAIMHEGEIIYSEGFGERDIGNNLPVDESTRFNIGSVSKIFTAAAILLLEDEGLLDLEDRVSDLLPGFMMNDKRYADITVRMLLNHTSGMGGTNMREAFSTKQSPEYLKQTMFTLSKSSLKHDPGAFSPYCNDGFTVTQALIEHLSGTSYHQFLQERIFNPLGMEDTSIGFKAEEANIAFAYSDHSTLLPREFVNAFASGGITSTAEDLCKFVLATFNPTMFSASNLFEFLKEQNPKYMRDTSYKRTFNFGLGWDFTSWEPYHAGGVQILGKSGGTLQYAAMLFVLPQTHSAVALLCSGHIDTVKTTLPIIDALLKETGQISSETKDFLIEANETKPLLPDVESYRGYYASDTTIFRIDFDIESSMMEVDSFDGSSFVRTSTSRHIGENVFEDTEGNLLALETLLGVPTIMEIKAPYNLAEIKMTQLDEQNSDIAHQFQESHWLPTNFLPHDLYLQVFRTQSIKELPSHLILRNNGVTPYAITDATQTSTALPAVRDQTPPWIDDEGNLMIGTYRCMDYRDIPPLVPGETIEVGIDYTSVWRRMTKHGILSCEIPTGARIIVLGPNFKFLEDTLYSAQNRFEMEVYGSYVAFIAEGHTIFNTTFVSMKERSTTAPR